MAHRAQRVQHISIQQRVQILQHGVSSMFDRPATRPASDGQSP
jgi:hypothetical protein